MSEQKDTKEHNVLYIDHRGELLIWLIIICIVVMFSTLVFRKKSHEDYNIFLPDVDGLIVGSPVRMMGIEVGHVTKIQPTNDEVFVSFIITKKDINIPQGTEVTVEFSGMAGSKSLELYLPDKDTYIDSNVPLLSVNPPKRLHDVFGLLNEMFETIGSIINTSSHFSKQLKTIEIPIGDSNIQDISNFVNYANQTIDEAQKRAENLEINLKYVKGK